MVDEVYILSQMYSKKNQPILGCEHFRLSVLVNVYPIWLSTSVSTWDPTAFILSSLVPSFLFVSVDFSIFVTGQTGASNSLLFQTTSAIFLLLRACQVDGLHVCLFDGISLCLTVCVCLSDSLCLSVSLCAPKEQKPTLLLTINWPDQ